MLESLRQSLIGTSTGSPEAEQVFHWFAVYTMPQSEESVRRVLDTKRVESFFPTYEVQRVWKNRQRVKSNRPLFPSYVFVRINGQQRGVVLRTPNALRIVGNHLGPVAIPDREVDMLRSETYRNRLEPYRELVIGKKVRIRCGPMEGLEGTLIEKRNSLRFILTVAMINQHAAIEVRGEELEAVRN
jgi:transcription antitermination factor NusG